MYHLGVPRGWGKGAGCLLHMHVCHKEKEEGKEKREERRRKRRRRRRRGGRLERGVYVRAQ